ncbi:GtrA family protein [Maribellus luteus]|uniref:GtrA family protein n=1 Tax=Maribellus luteus TaxID=2305463 RepID=A0A399T7C2_9BACT|nr:GtrA family protein [Maribellus luteus]RIJ50765.1 GtrA family protein [Maribellus luteus]
MRKLFESIGEFITRIIDWFYFPFLQFIPPEIFRYAATGGANTLFDLLLYFVFYQYILDMQVVELGFVAISAHIAAFLMVFPITFTTGFLLAKYVTFTASELKGRIQLFRYLVTVAGSIFLNYVFLKFFVEYCKLYAPISKLITTLLVVIYSYVAQRYFSFRTANMQLAARGNS